MFGNGLMLESGSNWILGSISLGDSAQTLNKLLGEVVDAPSLSLIKRHLGNAFNNLLKLVSPTSVSQLN